MEAGGHYLRRLTPAPAVPERPQVATGRSWRACPLFLADERSLNGALYGALLCRLFGLRQRGNGFQTTACTVEELDVTAVPPDRLSGDRESKPPAAQVARNEHMLPLIFLDARTSVPDDESHGRVVLRELHVGGVAVGNGVVDQIPERTANKS